jgi:hypothetical protein
MTMTTTFELFASTTPDWARFNTPENIKLLTDHATTYNASVTAFRRSFQELRDGHLLKPIPGYREPIPPVSREFRLKCASLSSSEIRRLYNVDREFHDLWDRMALEDDGGTIREVAEAPVTDETHLTASQYHAMPAAIITRKYASSPDFRRQVDALVQKGLI